MADHKKTQGKEKNIMPIRMQICRIAAVIWQRLL